MSHTVTVVIPVFNSAPYLEECLDSVLSQDLRDIEVICVDDESTDESLAILRSYEQRDPRVRVIEVPHGGQSMARNRALSEAGGVYVYFLDSDDKLIAGALRTMVELAEQRGTDILFFDGHTFFDSAELSESFSEYQDRYTRPSSYSDVVTGPELFARMYVDRTYRVSPCLALLRGDFLRATGAHFLEGVIFEDNHFMFTLIMQARRVSHENVPLFSRRIRENSTITSGVTARQCFGYFACWVEMIAFAVPYRWPDAVAAAVAGHLRDVRHSAIVYGGRVDPEEVRAMAEAVSPIYLDLFNKAFWRPILRAHRAAAEAQCPPARAAKPESKPDPREKELAALRKDNARLAKEVRLLRESTSFRVGRALARVPEALRRLQLRPKPRG